MFCRVGGGRAVPPHDAVINCGPLEGLHGRGPSGGPAARACRPAAAASAAREGCGDEAGELAARRMRSSARRQQLAAGAARRRSAEHVRRRRAIGGYRCEWQANVGPKKDVLCVCKWGVCVCVRAWRQRGAARAAAKPRNPYKVVNPVRQVPENPIQKR